MEKLYNFNSAKKIKYKKLFYLYKNYSNYSLPEIYKKFSFGKEIFTKSEGSFIFRKKKKILDLTGGFGVLNFGHNHKRILDVRKKFNNLKKIEVHKNFFNPYLAALSFNLSKILGKNLKYSFFCNSGAEANDGALKITYKYHQGKRRFVMSSDISFHGKTLGAGSISSGDPFLSKKFKFQCIPDVINYKYNDIVSVKKKFEKYGKQTYAFFVEPISCSTFKYCSKNFLYEVRRLCNKYDVILVYDEIYSGFAKCGPNFFFQKFQIYPDVITLSKSLGGGKSSISSYTTTAKVFKKAYGSLKESLIHSTTYNSFGEECATALEATNILIDENMSKKSFQNEAIIFEKLNNLKNKYPETIQEIRGSGSHFGILLKKDFLEFYRKILKKIPIKFISDPFFLDKLYVSSIIDSIYNKINCLTALSSNQEVILNISPSINIEKKDLNNKLLELEKIFKNSGKKNILNFLFKNIKELINIYK